MTRDPTPLIASCHHLIDSIISDFHAELSELATMDDVDDAILEICDGYPGPVFERIRREQLERRRGVRRVGNVVFATFGGGDHV